MERQRKDFDSDEEIEMNESILLKVSIIFSIIGILLLSYISLNIERTNIKKLFLEEEIVKEKGIINSIIQTDKATFITLETKKYEEIIIFSQVNLSIGDEIEVEGKRDEGIVADKIKKN